MKVNIQQINHISQEKMNATIIDTITFHVMILRLSNYKLEYIQFNIFV